MQQKKTKKRKIGRRQKKQLAIITLLLMIVSIIGVILLTPGFNIKEIKVTGNSVLKTEEIIATSGIQKGVNIFDFDKGKAKENILSMAYVAETKIKRHFPSTVEISIVEEVGVAYIKSENGYVIITADGRCIDDGVKKTDKDGKGTVEIPKMPLVKGMSNVKYKVGEKITSENNAQLEMLLKCLHEFSKREHVFNMLEIDMSNTNKIKFLYLSRDLEVVLGDAEKIDYKMSCFENLITKIGPNPQGTIHLENRDITFEPKKDAPAAPPTTVDEGGPQE